MVFRNAVKNIPNDPEFVGEFLRVYESMMKRFDCLKDVCTRGMEEVLLLLQSE